MYPPSTSGIEKSYLDSNDFRLYINGQELWDDCNIYIHSYKKDTVEFDIHIYNATGNPFLGLQYGLFLDCGYSAYIGSDVYEIPFEDAQVLLLSKSHIRALYPNSWTTVALTIQCEFGYFDKSFCFNFQLHSKKGVYNFNISMRVNTDKSLFGA